MRMKLFLVVIVISSASRGLVAEQEVDKGLIQVVKELKNKIELLEAASDRKFQFKLPVGTIIASPVRYMRFIDKQVDTSKEEWVIADGRPVADSSKYFQEMAAQWNDSERPYPAAYRGRVPDLRGVFLRGMNLDGGMDPEGSKRFAGAQVQVDSFKSHRHKTSGYDKAAWYGGNLVHAQANTKGGVQNNNVHASGGSETRPKNIAVYYYIKIN